MLTRQQIAQQARLAADLIETHGWFKDVEIGGRITAKRFPKGDGMCHCVLTALPMFDYIIVDYFARYLGFKGSDNGTSEFVTTWNDSQDGPEIVISTLRNFADAIEKELIEVG